MGGLEQSALQSFRIKEGMAQATLKKLNDLSELNSSHEQRILRVAYGSWANDGGGGGRKTCLNHMFFSSGLVHFCCETFCISNMHRGAERIF